MPVSKYSFKASIEDVDKSTTLMKYWSPKAHISVSFFPPASKSGFPGTITPTYLYVQASHSSQLHSQPLFLVLNYASSLVIWQEETG